VLQQTSDKRVVSLVGGAMYEGTSTSPSPSRASAWPISISAHWRAAFHLFCRTNPGDGPIQQYATKYRLAVDLALSALPGENRIYNGNVENIGEEIWAWEQPLEAAPPAGHPSLQRDRVHLSGL